MSGKTIILIALLFGLASAFVIASIFGNKKQDDSAIVVALSQIKAGNVIDEKQLKSTNFPNSSIPVGSFLSVQNLIGRVAKQEIFPGEPVLEAMLAPLDAKGGLSSTIALGKRAITVHVNEVVAVAGFALPGSFVDVIVTVKGSQENMVSKTVLRRVKVLAIAQETDAVDAKPKVVNAVTLELTPKEVEILDLARSAGNLSLSLRNTFDNTEDVSSGTTYQELVSKTNVSEQPKTSTNMAQKSSHKTQPSIQKAINQEDKVEVIKGNSRAEMAY